MTKGESERRKCRKEGMGVREEEKRRREER